MTELVLHMINFYSSFLYKHFCISRCMCIQQRQQTIKISTGAKIYVDSETFIYFGNAIKIITSFFIVVLRLSLVM